jgi:hypothetical protein
MVDLKQVLQDRAAAGVVEELIPLLAEIFSRLEALEPTDPSQPVTPVAQEGHHA